MFLAMIKKEIKQFLRSKSNLLMMFLFPIALIATLGTGLEELMTSADEIFGKDDKKDLIYYNIEDDNSIYEHGFMEFIEGIEKEIKVKFKENENIEKSREKVDQEKALIHISVLEDGFEIYTSKNGESTKATIMRSIFESVLNNYATYGAIYNLNPEAVNNNIVESTNEYVEYQDSKADRDVTAKEYYTFAELALIILYVATIVGESVYNEKRLTTINRIRLSKVSESLLILSKVLSGVIIGLVQTLVVYLFSTFAMDVDWGENTFKFLMIFVVFSIFASMLGAIVGILCNKETSVNGILSAIIFAFCLLGGSYTPLAMLVGVPGLNIAMYLSPIYWINTATSSMIVGYNSEAYIYALAIPLVLSAIFLAIYLGVAKKKGGIQDA